jgi:hypothetical protein
VHGCILAVADPFGFKRSSVAVQALTANENFNEKFSRLRLDGCKALFLAAGLGADF